MSFAASEAVISGSTIVAGCIMFSTIMIINYNYYYINT
jgi:hypothetical protein